jgi:release factor glutamine methyltransferase
VNIELPSLPDAQAALVWARQQIQSAQADIDPSSVQHILATLLHSPRASLLAHPETPLSESIGKEFSRQVLRLIRGEPLAYLTGEREFYGLPFYVTVDTLIPRPETELLVEQARKHVASGLHVTRIIDVGTGSGCIAVSLAYHIPSAFVVASDISGSGLKVARRNAIRHQLSERVCFVQMDLLSAISGSFDLICANLPYIPTETLRQLDVARHEPWRALDGGPNGLRWIKTLLEQAASRLARHGILLMEIEESEGPAACNLAQNIFPQSEIRIQTDWAGRDRLLEVVV